MEDDTLYSGSRMTSLIFFLCLHGMLLLQECSPKLYLMNVNQNQDDKDDEDSISVSNQDYISYNELKEFMELMEHYDGDKYRKK